MSSYNQFSSPGLGENIIYIRCSWLVLSTTDEKWFSRNLGGDFHASGLITLYLSSSNPARPYIWHISTFTCCGCTDSTAITRDSLYFWIFSELGRQRMLITVGKQDEGTVSIKIDD